MRIIILIFQLLFYFASLSLISRFISAHWSITSFIFYFKLNCIKRNFFVSLSHHRLLIPSGLPSRIVWRILKLVSFLVLPPIGTHGSMVFPSVCPSVTLVHPAKTLGRNDMQFHRDTRVVPNNIVLDRGPEPPV